jgi:hypothetical protein
LVIADLWGLLRVGGSVPMTAAPIKAQILLLATDLIDLVLDRS